MQHKVKVMFPENVMSEFLLVFVFYAPMRAEEKLVVTTGSQVTYMMHGRSAYQGPLIGAVSCQIIILERKQLHHNYLIHRFIRPSTALLNPWPRSGLRSLGPLQPLRFARGPRLPVCGRNRDDGVET